MTATFRMNDGTIVLIEDTLDGRILVLFTSYDDPAEKFEVIFNVEEWQTFLKAVAFCWR